MQVIGWDIGGAHVKAVLLDEAGAVLNIQQEACPLWLGLDRLEQAMLTVLERFSVSLSQVKHAVTMTGELVDLFTSRHEGVLAISNFVDTLLGRDVLFYVMSRVESGAHFVTIEQVADCTKMIASANWHASAWLLAQEVPSALLVDIGSTTTDIIVIDDNKVVNYAFTDAARMQHDTLVYTGVIRTPVMAVAQKVYLDEKETNVAAEYFATMADVYRLTEELPVALDMAETADGEGKTKRASARRLARMVGHDLDDKPLESWLRLAQFFRERQCRQVQLAMQKYLKEGMVIVGAGVGHFLVESIAQTLGYPYTALTMVLNDQRNGLAVCLPAYAVARLAHDKGVV